jgi:DegV family protein with EDD domain
MFRQGEALYMRKIKFITDSTSDLTTDIYKKYDIDVLPLIVILDGTEYRDGVDIKTAELYKKIEEKNVMPKTAAIAPKDFLIAFNQWLEKDYDIIYIGIGSKLSATYSNAILAMEDIPEAKERIRLIDSGNLSTGISLTLLHGIDYAAAGHTLDEVAKEMERVVPLVRAQFVVEEMTYLYKGGRCSGLTYLMGKLVRARPFLQVIDGKIENTAAPKGKMIKGLNHQLDVFIEDYQTGIYLDRVFVTHSQTPESAQYYIEKIKEVAPEANIILTEAGCVISSHCGAGTIGILYIRKQA